MLTSTRPLLFGYLRLRISDSPDAVDTGRQLLRDFADAEGFALVDVFVDADENTPQAALAALIRCVQDADVHLSGIAVAVPDLGHLGANAVTQRQMRARIQTEARVRVVVPAGR